MSQGRAIYTMEFDSYAPVSETIGRELVAKSGGFYQLVS